MDCTPNVIVDPELRALVPSLTDEECAQLEANLVKDGCLHPLIAWKEEDVLLDGHNRKEICDRNGLKYKTHGVSLPNRDSAKRWIIEHQFGRRNLTLFQRAELALKLKPLIAAEAKEKQRKSGGAVHQKSGEAPIRTDKQLASRAEVSHDTIAKAEYILKHSDEKTLDSLRHGETTINAEYNRLRGAPAPHVAHNSGDNEWYTPPEYIEAARKTMGGIDCDPASSEHANEIVKADKFWTAEQDGLKQAWGKRVWMNPPYAQPLCAHFCRTLVFKVTAGEVEAACVLVNNATETEWFRTLIRVASAAVFPFGRIKFLDPDGAPRGAPLQGQAVIYIGPDTQNFLAVFRPFGWDNEFGRTIQAVEAAGMAR